MSKNNKKSKAVNKFNYLKTCIITILVIVIGVGLYFFLTAEDNKTSLTILEKQWILKNKKTLIDINVPNNLSILADNGEGVIFDYLSKIEKETGLNFNKKSYNYKVKSDSLNGLGIVVLSNEDKILSNDVLISEDNYVVLGMNEGYLNNLNDLYNKKIGILKNDKTVVSNYVSNNFEYVEYDTVGDLVNNLKNNKVSYAIAPRYYVLRDVVNHNVYINYSFNNLSNKLVLRAGKSNRLFDIMNKYLKLFKSDNYMSSYEKTFMKFYLSNTDTTDLDTSTLSSKIYKYGYVENSTYNILNGKKLYGFAGEYVNLLSNMANMDLEYKEYSSKEELSSAIKSGNIDLAFIDFDYKNEQGLYTVNSFSPQMVAISKTNYRISNKDGLQNRKLYTPKNNYLENYLKDNYNSSVQTIKNVDASIPNDAILVLDEIDYHYYSNKKAFDDYYLLLKDDYTADYKFYVKSDEKVMYNFINFMMMYTDGSDIKIQALDQLITTNQNKGGVTNTY